MDMKKINLKKIWSLNNILSIPNSSRVIRLPILYSHTFPFHIVGVSLPSFAFIPSFKLFVQLIPTWKPSYFFNLKLNPLLPIPRISHTPKLELRHVHPFFFKRSMPSFTLQNFNVKTLFKNPMQLKLWL